MKTKFIFCLNVGTIENRHKYLEKVLKTSDFVIDYKFKCNSLADALYQVYLSNKSGISDEYFKEIINLYNDLLNKFTENKIKKFGIITIKCLIKD